MITNTLREVVRKMNGEPDGLTNALLAIHYDARAIHHLVLDVTIALVIMG